MLEKEIEAYLCKRIKQLGGMCEKFTSPQKRSVPDRIITLPNNNIIFVETKAEGKNWNCLYIKQEEWERLGQTPNSFAEIIDLFKVK